MRSERPMMFASKRLLERGKDGFFFFRPPLQLAFPKPPLAADLERWDLLLLNHAQNCSLGYLKDARRSCFVPPWLEVASKAHARSGQRPKGLFERMFGRQ